MTDKPHRITDAPGSTIDAEIADLLDRYLTDRQRGVGIDRDQWLRQHPQHADRLAQCLDAADLFGDAETGGFDLPSETGMPGSIGDYEIRRELGRGGMGVVYEARERSLDRIVALKVMRFGIVDSNALDRFQREAETAGALHHTNIVPVYATGREGDTSWYAMQRIDGESLAARITRSREANAQPTIDQILDVGIQAADALAHAHERDIVHRDVKPANLILDQDERVWLTDFGLARRLVDVGATMTGAILGTPRYMSPEQADLRTTDVDHRSDIYSLGATLYEMSTGRPPFAGDDPLELITKIRYEDPPSVRNLRADLPRDLEVVLMKAMEKDAMRRYQSAGEFADDLRAIGDDHPIHARPLSILEKTARFSRKHQSRVRVAVAAMAVTAVLIAALLVGFDRWNQSRRGAFRIRAGSGPYQATVFPVGQSQLSDAAFDLTVPMQNHQELVAGDYDMMVSRRGRWSRKIRLPVTKGIPSEYRITDEPVDSKAISIKGALAVTVAADQGSAILWRREGELRRIGAEPSDQWQRDVSLVDTPVTTLIGAGDSGSFQIGDSRLINFAYTKESSNFDRGQHSLQDAPLLTQGAIALKSRVDLDGDRRADTLIAAVDRQALLAIAADGNLLWSRAYGFAGLPIKSDVPEPFNAKATLPFPGVFDLQDVGDVDADGISDIAATLVHYRMAAQTDTCLLIVSGKTGEPIRWVNRSFTAKQNVFWPVDGIFQPNRYRHRSSGGLSFSSESAHRSGHRYPGDFFIRARRGSTPLRIAVPSPPQVLRSGNGIFFVQLAGDQCNITDLESADANSVTIKLPFLPPHAPRLARSGNSHRLIFHSHKPKNFKTTPSTATEVIAYDLSGNQVWKKRLGYIDWKDAIAENHADWPCVVDLEGDGNDEVVFPRNRYRDGVELGVALIDAATGDSLWPDELPFTSYRCADDCLSRMTMTDDTNGDGWSEIATASISGVGSPRGALSDAEDRDAGDKAFVYIDWLCGKTGKRIAWARHPISNIGDQIRVAQIDAIRSGLPGTPAGTVEIDVVSGDRTLDVMLESAVIRFHPGRPGPTAIALGLDVCETPSDSLSSVRAYRRRGGPFGVGDDDLVLLPNAESPSKRLGESLLAASWSGREGRNVIAAHGFMPSRMSVVDAKTGQTVWSDRPNRENVKWIPVTRPDGSVDFLVQQQRARDRPPALVDGDTGEEIFQMSDVVGGRVIFARVTADNQSALIIGDGLLESRSAGAVGPPVNAFRMSMVSLATGAIRWSTTFLFGAARNNYPDGFDDLQLVDVNGDGVEDIIGPDSNDNDLFLCAWNGSTGGKLWERSVFQTPARTDYYIPFSTVRIGGELHVVYLGHPAKASTEKQLLLIGPNGDLVESHRLDRPAVLSWVDRYGSHRLFEIADATVLPEQPSVAIGRDFNGRNQCLVFSLAEKQFTIKSLYEEKAETEFMVGMWFRDVDGDGVTERLVINRVMNDVDGETGRKVENGSLWVKCFPIDSDEPTFEIRVPDASVLQSIVWRTDHAIPVSWLCVNQDRYVAIDWSKGELLTETNGYAEKTTNLPIICRRERSGYVMAIPTPDGIEFRPIDAQDQPAITAVESHQYADPRRMKRLFSTIGGDTTLGQWLFEMVRGGMALTILVVLPLWYIARTVRQRRWGLSWMLLLPVIVGLGVVVWRNPSIHDPGLIINLLQGVSLWMCGAALMLAFKNPKDGQGLSIRLVMLVGIPLVFLALVFFEYHQADDPAMLYSIDVMGLIRVGLLSLMLVSQIYWMLRIPVSAVRSLRGVLQRRSLT